jgi:hypothetical protein
LPTLTELKGKQNNGMRNAKAIKSNDNEVAVRIIIMDLKKKKKKIMIEIYEGDCNILRELAYV